MSKGERPNLPVDLVLVFKSTTRTSSRQEIKENAERAKVEYDELLDTLRRAGLEATGRRGERGGDVLVFIWCPVVKLVDLARRERRVRRLVLR